VTNVNHRFLAFFLVALSLTAFASVFSVSARPYSEALVSAHAFTTIQAAINNASTGDTVIVPSGVYYEHVIVNKSISLIGQVDFSAVIDGSNSGTVVEITAHNVKLSFFKLQNSGYGWNRHGVYVYKANDCTIQHNRLFKTCHNIKLNYTRSTQVLDNEISGVMTQPTMYGIRVQHSLNCTVAYNNISDCVGAIHLENSTKCTVKRNNLFGNNQGIRLYSPCVNNRIFENLIQNSAYDGMIERMPGNTTLFNNTFFHNNFVNNTHQFVYKSLGTVWDGGYPSCGNYWSRYNDSDMYSGVFQNETGSDGIGDAPYGVSSDSSDVDRYPLMHPYGSVHNEETGLDYWAISSALDASETIDGHTVLVKNGIYREHLVINKQVSLIGEDQATTIIDGEDRGTVLTINAKNITVSQFTIRNGGHNYPPYGNDCGLLLNGTSGCSVTHNLITDNRIGVSVYFSEFNTLEHNTVVSNQENGIWLWYSGSNTLKENTISDNPYNFGTFGGQFSHFANLIDTSNSVDGKPIQYLINVKDLSFDAQTEIGTLYLINSFNITVRDLVLKNNGNGLFCYNTTYSKIENVTVEDTNYGICLRNSMNNTVQDSYCHDNWVGIFLQDSKSNSVTNNLCVNSEKGISLYGSHSNKISGNSLENNIYGIRLSSSHSNKIFHNNLLRNEEQANLISSFQNVWNHGSEGNYWSDYPGQDLNRDGVGDIPHDIDANNQDLYPLMLPWGTGDINRDGKVSPADLVLLTEAYGSRLGDPIWDPNADIDNNGIVGLSDLVLLTKCYGKVYE
jgi:parallel beta-helix repeat protein